jgi:FkbM family methyltransferase
MMSLNLKAIYETQYSSMSATLDLSKPGTSIYIYGTGAVGRDDWQVLTAHGISVKGFIDHIKREITPISGIRVLGPTSLPLSARKGTVIVLAIHNRAVDMQMLISRLKASGYSKFVSMIDLYDRFRADLGGRFWLTDRNFYKDFETQISAANMLWCDDSSREIYAKILEFRISGNFSLLPEPDLSHQYFPLDLPAWKQPIILIECGAYDGDDIRNFTKNGYAFSAVAAFEPDMQNYNRLAKYFQANPEAIPEISLWPCGVYSNTCQLGFEAGMGESSSIARTAKTIIHCVALDEALPNFAPTLIEMDIEGAELEAIMGAKNVISRYHPALAISIYHLPQHLWELPLQIDEISKNANRHYQSALRTHAYNGFDTILYAIPVNA